MSDSKPLRVRESEALSGELPVPGGRSMFRILLDEETVGAKQFALLINEFDPGLTSTAHKHDTEEHAFYIISGTGLIDIEGEKISVEAGDESNVRVMGPEVNRLDPGKAVPGLVHIG